MIVVETIPEVRAALTAHRAGTVGLVPTMGALHDGHRALLAAARAECDFVCMSLFVNPAQFGEDGDFERYPRERANDEEVAAGCGVDLVFAPAESELYPDGFQTWVEVGQVGERMEGAARPGHFRGVATVCLKLFNIVQPDRAYFGQKDVQQAAVVERMVADFDLPLTIRVVATVRDADGLALSSRNVHLSPGERELALELPRALAVGKRAHEQGHQADSVARALLFTTRRKGVEVDYVEKTRLDGCLVLAAAIRVGSTRLIDNVVLEGDLP